MALWVAFAIMSAAVLAALLHPLLRSRAPGAGSGPAPGAAGAPGETAHADSGETAVYRDQLSELDADAQRGLIAPDEAQAARAEVARRLIAAEAARAAAASATATAAGPSHAATALPHRFASILALGVPLAALLVYLAVGSPTVPGQPLAARQDPAKGPAPVKTSDDIGRLIAAVEARLRAHPEDGQGWDVIAPIYLRQGRYTEAADAFGRALRLLGENTKRLAGFAEASVLASDGIVTEEARKAYETLTRLAPERIEPRFWLTLAKEQDGQLQEALAGYEKMLADGPPDATWRPLVVERVRLVNERLGRKLPPAPAPVTAPPAGPTGADIAAIERLPPAERLKMIEGMVEGLAAKLARNGRDLDGWQRLIRAYTVLGRKQDAVAALGTARGHFAGEPQSLATLGALARTLGLES